MLEQKLYIPIGIQFLRTKNNNELTVEVVIKVIIWSPAPNFTLLSLVSFYSVISNFCEIGK